MKSMNQHSEWTHDPNGRAICRFPAPRVRLKAEDFNSTNGGCDHDEEEVDTRQDDQ
jgi:hypothetical protein